VVLNLSGAATPFEVSIIIDTTYPTSKILIFNVLYTIIKIENTFKGYFPKMNFK